MGLKKILRPSLIVFFIVAGVIGFAVLKIPKVWNALTELNIFKVSPLTFEFQTPVWVTDRFSNDIKSVAALQEEYGLYEDGLTQKIADVYSKFPVVKRVDSISRIFPNTLDIKLALRKPAPLLNTEIRLILWTTKAFSCLMSIMLCQIQSITVLTSEAVNCQSLLLWVTNASTKGLQKGLS